MKLVQLASIVVYGLIAIWYVVPWLRRLGRADALIALLWVHVFRYVVLNIFTAQRESYPISDTAALQLVVGDLAGAAIALTAIVCLRSRLRLGLAFSWLLIVESIADLLTAIYQRSIEPPRADAGGVWWLVFSFFAPLILVSLPLLVWQLYARRGEPLTDADVGRDGTPDAGQLVAR